MILVGYTGRREEIRSDQRPCTEKKRRLFDRLIILLGLSSGCWIGRRSPAQGLRRRCRRGRLLPVTEPVKKITGLPSIPCSCTGNCRRKRRRNGVASNDRCRNQIAANSDLDWVVSCFRLGPTSPCRNTAGVLTTAAAACRRRRRRSSAPCAVAVEVD